MASPAQVSKSQIIKLPEVVASVVTDRSGMLVESTGDIDGEAAGAVNAVSAEALALTGETLGLGELQRASITGPNTACVIAVQGDEVVGVYVDPKKPIGPFEMKVEGVLRR